MIFAWSSYKKYAWGYDELKPLEKKGQNWMGVGLSIVDAIDTLWIMEMHEEYQEAREFVKNLKFTSGGGSVFEMNIRVLGGLLSTYALTKDEMFLEKAKEFGDILLHVSFHSTKSFSLFHLCSQKKNFRAGLGRQSVSHATPRLGLKDEGMALLGSRIGGFGRYRNPPNGVLHSFLLFGRLQVLQESSPNLGLYPGQL